jgi:hypothetical protein
MGDAEDLPYMPLAKLTEVLSAVPRSMIEDR